MNEESKTAFIDPQTILDIILRRRWLIIIPLIISGIAGLYLAVTLPKTYSATTLIIVQPQRVPKGYVQSLVTTGIESRIATLSQEILSRTNLEKVINQFKLFSGPEQQDMFMEEKVAALQGRIDIEVTRSRGRRGAPNAFSITYSGSRPKRVSAITNALAALFIDENLKLREDQALGTSDFLKNELLVMKERLEKTEAALRNYRFKYMGELPDQLDSNLRILDRLQREIADKEEGLRDAKARLVALSEQQVDGNGQSPGQYSEMSSNQLQNELNRLQSRYTDKHPDIILLKQLLEETPSDNPQGESRAVIDTKNEITELEEYIEDLSLEIAQYNKRVEYAPQREAELLSLQRDYNNLQRSYSNLLNRKLEAEIAVNMERKQKGEQFRVIDPARTPNKPVMPDTKRLFLMALAGGIGLGAGLCFLLEFSSQVFRRPDEIENLLGVPLIATIPMITGRKDRIKAWANNALTVVAGGAVCLTYGLFGVLILMGENALNKILQGVAGF